MSSKKHSNKFNPPPKDFKKELKQELLQFSSLESEFDYFRKQYQNLIGYDSNAIIHTATEFLDDPQAVADDLRESPEKLFYEPVYQNLVWFLRGLCQKEQNQKNKWARQLLRDMGLSIFIPDVPNRTTDHAYLLHYKKNPEELMKDVEEYCDKIKSHINPNKPLYDNEDEIEVLFKQIFNQEPLEELLEGERLLQIKTVALSFLSYEIEAPYSSLKRIYYTKK